MLGQDELVARVIAAFFNRQDHSKRALKKEPVLVQRTDGDGIIQVAICADAGAGKSTALRLLKETLSGCGFSFVSGGDFQREQANAQGMLLEQFQREVLPTDTTFDRRCDEYLITAGVIHKRLIVESRIGHTMLPEDALKVKFVCPLEVRARRNLPILRTKHERPDMTEQEALEILDGRDKGDRIRLHKKYPNCIWKDEHFGLIVNTEKNSPNAVVQILLDAILDHAGLEYLHDLRLAA